LSFHNRSAKDSAIALLIVSSILWGSSFVSIKIGLAYLNAFDFAFLRLASASAILVVILVLNGRLKLASLKEKGVWALGLLNGIGFSLQYVGLQFTTPAKTALLIDMNVIAVAILSWRFFQESFGLRKQLAVIMGVLGAVMITTNGDLSTLTHGEFLGDVLVLFAGLVWAVFIILHKRVLSSNDRNAIELSAVVMSATAFLLFPVALLFGRLGVQVIPIEGWVWVGYTAIVCQVVPYALWVFALKSVTATIASVVGMLEIVAAMILSSLLLAESYNTATLLGAGLILLSILAVAEI